jgi:hypothetical protein
MTIYKTTLVPKPRTLSSNSGSLAGNIIWGQKPMSNSIIVDLTKQVSQAMPESMEVTHDVFYNRLDKNQSDYTIKRFSILIREEIMSNPIVFQTQIKIPHRFRNYTTILGNCITVQGKTPPTIIIP